MSYFDDVAEWDASTGIIKEATTRLRVDVMTEEWEELRDALADCDLVGIADACADLIWTVLGVANHFGIPFDKVWEEVRKSNFNKVGPHGEIVRRPDGKILKWPGWTPPDIEGVLRDEGLL